MKINNKNYFFSIMYRNSLYQFGKNFEEHFLTMHDSSKWCWNSSFRFLKLTIFNFVLMTINNKNWMYLKNLYWKWDPSITNLWRSNSFQIDILKFYKIFQISLKNEFWYLKNQLPTLILFVYGCLIKDVSEETYFKVRLQKK